MKAPWNFRNVHLNCSSAQKMPLFLPMVSSEELMASTFPWAVHRTETQRGNINTEKTCSTCRTGHKMTSVYRPLLFQQAQTPCRSSKCTGKWTWRCSRCREHEETLELAWKQQSRSLLVSDGSPVQKPTKKHGQLRSNDSHHWRGDQVGCRENSIDDGHAASDRCQES